MTPVTRELLADSTLRVDVAGEPAGTGFVVAPGFVVTSAEVLSVAEDQHVWLVDGAGTTFRAEIEDAWPESDVALVRAADLPGEHGCVRLDTACPEDGTALMVCTHRRTPAGVAKVSAVQTFTFDSARRAAMDARVRPAVADHASGGAVLNLATGGVCGALRGVSTRSRQANWMVPSYLLRRRWPHVARAHDAFHQHGGRPVRRGSREDLSRRVFGRTGTGDATASPGAPLLPEHAVVPFAGRDGELAALTEWCAEPTAFAVRLVTAAGGQGKTRLALEITARQRAHGWFAGLVDHTAVDAGGELPADTYRDLATCPDPLLLAVDDASTRGALVAQLTRLCTERRRHRTRLLLLACSAGEWLAALREQAADEEAIHLAHDVEHPLRSLADVAGLRHTEFYRALAAFAGLRGTDTLGVGPPQDLEEGGYDRVLDIHTAALAAVLDRTDAAPTQPHARGPLARLLAHERMAWARSAAAEQLPDPHPRRLDAVVAVTTLCGPLGEPETAAVLTGLPTFAGRACDAVAYARWAADSRPGPAWLEPLRPRLLAEDHVAATLADQPELVPAVLATASGAVTLRALTVLAHVGARHPRVATQLTTLLARVPGRIDGLAADPIDHLAGVAPLLEALIAGITCVPPEVLALLVDRLPRSNRLLAGFATHLSDVLLDRRRGAAHPDPAAVGTLLHAFGGYLAEAGRHDEAVAAGREAVTLRRGLARTDPESHQVALASSLTMWARHLHTAGQPDRACRVAAEAEIAWRDVDPDDPDATDATEATAGLADTLGLLARLLRLSGRDEEAAYVAEEAAGLEAARAVDFP